MILLLIFISLPYHLSSLPSTLTTTLICLHPHPMWCSFVRLQYDSPHNDDLHDNIHFLTFFYITTKVVTIGQREEGRWCAMKSMGTHYKICVIILLLPQPSPQSYCIIDNSICDLKGINLIIVQLYKKKAAKVMKPRYRVKF